MHEALEAMGPIQEAAVGLRARLEADGYSPSAAEYLSAKYMTMCMRSLRLTISVDIEGWSEPDDGLPVESGQ